MSGRFKQLSQCPGEHIDVARRFFGLLVVDDAIQSLKRGEELFPGGIEQRPKAVRNVQQRLQALANHHTREHGVSMLGHTPLWQSIHTPRGYLHS